MHTIPHSITSHTAPLAAFLLRCQGIARDSRDLARQLVNAADDEDGYGPAQTADGLEHFAAQMDRLADEARAQRRPAHGHVLTHTIERATTLPDH